MDRKDLIQDLMVVFFGILTFLGLNQMIGKYIITYPIVTLIVGIAGILLAGPISRRFG